MKLGARLGWSTYGIGLVVLLSCGYLLYRISAHTYLDQRLAELERQARAASSLSLDHMRRAGTTLTALAPELAHRLQAPVDRREVEEFDRLVRRDADGALRMRRDAFDGSREAGIFIPAGVEPDDRVKANKVRARRLLGTVAISALRHYDGLWFDQLDKTSVIFWRRDPDFIYKLPPDHDYTQTLWDQLASPRLNPRREPKWTPVILEQPVGVWVVSCVYPLDIEGRWEGVLGIDVAVTELLDSLRQADPYPGSRHFLIDAYGNYILAGPWQRELEGSSEHFVPPLASEPGLAALLRAELPGTGAALSRRLEFAGEPHRAFAYLIPGLGWRYYRLVPEREVLAPMRRLFYLGGAGLAGALLLLLLMTKWLTRHWVLTPLERLATVVRRYGAGELDARAAPEGDNEIGTLGEAFNTMAGEISRRGAELAASELHYRTLVDGIREVVIQLDPEGRIAYASSAWEGLQGSPPEAATGRPLTEFLHPGDRQRWQRALGEWDRAEDLRLDLRLLCPGGFHWVELKLIRDGEEETVTATLDDISARKFGLLVERVFADLERRCREGVGERELLAELCERLAAIFEFPLVWIGLREGGRAWFVAGGELAGLLEDLRERLEDPRLEHCPAWRAIQDGRPSVLEFQPGELKAPFDRHAGRLRCLASLPLPDEGAGTPRGVLNFHAPGSESFPPQALERFAGIAARVPGLLQRAAEQRWLWLQQEAMASAANAIFITDRAGRIEWVNPAFEGLTGHGAEAVAGRPARMLDGGEGGSRLDEIRAHVRNGEPWRGELLIHTAGGKRIPVIETVTPLRGADGRIRHTVCVLEDISARKRAEAELEYLASHDPLTGLPNRMLLLDRLERVLARARREERQAAVLFLDLDGFKYINDSLGHEAGDHLLQAVARRIRACLREEDTLARQGGDEFLILLPGLESGATAATVAGKLLQAFREPFEVEGRTLGIGASIGISLFPADGGDPGCLIRRADAAMYQAKAEGRGRFHFYTRAIEAQVSERMELEQGLQEALERDELVPWYQPQVAIGSGEVIGCEALARWVRGDGEVIPPARFIAVAEESGLIAAVGERVMSAACRQFRQWRREGLPLPRLSINVSALQLHDGGLPERVAGLLHEFGIPAGALELELTESILLREPDRAIEQMERLRGIGVRLALDDFGTGFASLQYLLRLPLDVIKIDRGFIADLECSERHRSLAEMACHLGRRLGLEVVAEGVEGEGQLKLLREMGCDAYQGYLTSPPRPAREFAGLLDARRGLGAGSGREE